ncbi:hypothetical protein PT974_04919 [Cladobotryum mycophilum]|uniref:Antifungal protein n=1 Tax=Cladobotryum mycophilum TaxID=491253 RepID=A0ABR0SRU4_9HYPO
MKFTAALTVLFSLAAIGTATPTGERAIIAEPLPTDGATIFSAYKSCSSIRTNSDKCTGKRLGPQNSWHNCKNRDGKCCAAHKDGSGGQDVARGQGREDCGYCFSGKCKA